MQMTGMTSFTEKRRKAPPFRAGDIRRDFALS